MTNKNNTIGYFLKMALALAAAMLWSCSTFPEDEFAIGEQGGRPGTSGHPDRNSGGSRENVFIVYSMGYNNLSYDLNEDIDELLSGEVPSFNPNDNAILIMNHSTQNDRSNYTITTSPVLYHAYKTLDGSIKRDTLVVYPEGSKAATKEMLNKVLTYVQEKFPAKHYGMLVSSHATGWAPEMYCYSPPDKSSSGIWMSKEKEFKPLDKYTDERPLTRSIGAHFNGSSANMNEIELQDFAQAIPFHLDYIIFDCCLMGGVEVAYQLRDICDKVCFSQTEILAGGMDYANMTEHLFGGKETSLESVASDYYMKYATKDQEIDRSATVSVVDCRRLEKVAEIVKKNRDTIEILSGSWERNSVQKYFQSRLSRNHGIFFDLEDILIKADVSQEDLDALSNALKESVVCKFATPTFLSGLKIQHHSGLSMYLPDPDRERLNEYYQTLDWNKATGLITVNE